MKTKAYSYIRFSTKKQEWGESYSRQKRLRDDYLARHPELELDTEINLYDPGLSSFRGQNLDPTKGYLGKFIKSCEAGEIRLGSYLIVESLDRFSRAQTSRVLQVITRLVVDFGLTIVFLEPNEQVVTEDLLNKDLHSLLWILISASSANLESANKSRRTKDNWEAARKRARENPKKKLTTKCPSWLRFDKEKEDFVEIPSKADSIRRVFELSAKGVGTVRIAKIMNEEALPISTHDLKGRPRRWNKSYVSKILKDRSVIGEYQPKRMNYELGIRETQGEPIKGYFPRIISDELFYSSLTQIALNRKTRAESTAEFINLFKGLVLNMVDGSSMQIATSRVKRKNGDAYIQRRLCSYEYTRTGKGCPWSIDYFMVEDLVLHSLTEIRPKDFKGESKRPQLLRTIEQKITGMKEAIAAYDQQFKNPKYRTMFDDILAAKVNLQNELIIEQQKYEQLLSSTEGDETRTQENIKMLKSLLGKEELFADKKQRMELVQILPRFVSSIRIVPVKFKNRQVGGFGSILMRNNQVRNFVLCKQPGLNRRVISTTGTGRIHSIATPNGFVFFEREDDDNFRQGTIVMQRVKGKKAKELKTNSVLLSSIRKTREKFHTADYLGGFGEQNVGRTLFKLDRNEENV